MARGGAIYTELCFSCHGDDGRGTPVPGARAGVVMAPSLSGSSRVNGHRDYVIKPLLHGMSGPIDGKTYPAGHGADGLEHRSMDRRRRELRSQQLRELRDVGDARRTSRGFARPPPVGRRRGRSASWKRRCRGRCSGRHVEGHRQSQLEPPPPGALDYTRWTSDAPQQPGMWIQVASAAARHADRDPVRFAAHRRRAGVARHRSATFPRGYRVEVSTDGTTWSAPVAEGQGSGRVTAIAFAPVRASFVRITQTATTRMLRSGRIERLRLYEAPSSR